ncbi:ATP-binding protein [Peribacillus sp. SCS-26]|uniref:ATP-binding protein n=1 Tax=Paraperibacillus marinus TaxID=3115295 RepID=UPI0039060D3B
MVNTFVIQIREELDIVSARKKGREAARLLCCDVVDQAKIITAISELGRNISQYAGSGKIIVEVLQDEEVYGGIRITAVDDGPGIENIKKAMEPGFSTSGGLGTGLSGVRNLMDEFYIDSAPGKGTIVVITKWLKSRITV